MYSLPLASFRATSVFGDALPRLLSKPDHFAGLIGLTLKSSYSTSWAWLAPAKPSSTIGMMRRSATVKGFRMMVLASSELTRTVIFKTVFRLKGLAGPAGSGERGEGARDSTARSFAGSRGSPPRPSRVWATTDRARQRRSRARAGRLPRRRLLGTRDQQRDRRQGIRA